MFKNITRLNFTSTLKSRETDDTIISSVKPLINYVQIAGYKKRQTGKLSHKPTFDEYDKLPGDEYQTVYYGYYDGKRHTDPRAFDRFYRLNWGGWIRARGGRNHQIWRKNSSRKWWDKQHILCSESQSKVLEQMFEQKYRKKTYFVDDWYETYEYRDAEFVPYGHQPINYSYVKSKEFTE